MIDDGTHEDNAPSPAVAGLILLNSYARLAWSPDYPHGIRPEEGEGLLRVVEKDCPLAP